MMLAMLQIILAVCSIYLTNQNTIDMRSCLTGIFGMYGNAAIFVGLSCWAGFLLIKSVINKRINPLLGLLIVVLAITGFATIIHTRSALLCTV